MSEHSVWPLELEMGYSVDEFVRVLPAAMRDWHVSGGPLQWRVRHAAELDIRIDMQPLPDRRMGALSVPVLAVIITPQPPTSSPLMEEFMRRFERGFHRGGG